MLHWSVSEFLDVIAAKKNSRLKVVGGTNFGLI